MCDRLLRDPDHLFRKMWAVPQRVQLRRGEQACWDVARDDQWKRSNSYFDDLWDGHYCDTNWYEGRRGDLGEFGRLTPFPSDQPAPALLGFDQPIGDFCAHHQVSQGRFDGWCRGANLNILQLLGNRVPYNTCRNFEWQMCAAKGAAYALATTRCTSRSTL